MAVDVKNMEIIAADNIRSGYTKGDVLQGISISVGQGEIVGVLGRNGVGKSTLIKTLIGLLPVRQGSVSFQNENITGMSADERARKGIGYVPQGRHIFPFMSVAENLKMGTFINKKSSRLRYDLIYDHFPFLKSRAKQSGGTLSGGEQEMLAIARALVGDPAVLLLDEPSEGVQPNIVQEIGEFIVELNKKEGLSVLIVEQNIDLMQAVVTRGYVLDKGRVVANLNREELQKTEEVAKYLAI